MDENLKLQAEELEVMSSIYGNDWNVINSDKKIYNIKLYSNEEETNTINLQVTLPVEYPKDAPPIYQLSAPWLKGEERLQVMALLDDIFCEQPGECILFLWAEKIRQFLQDKLALQENENENENENIVLDDSSNILIACAASLETDLNFFECPSIIHGDPITDRKSTFQPHLARVVSTDQVKQFLQKLKENKKIASATHNILAYRIVNEANKSYIQDYDDDGETHAGSRLLHLLQVLNAENVAVVVTRWYGGTLLGPDRFKHISNCARDVLEKAGFMKNNSNAKIKQTKQSSKK